MILNADILISNRIVVVGGGYDDDDDDHNDDYSDDDSWRPFNAQQEANNMTYASQRLDLSDILSTF